MKPNKELPEISGLDAAAIGGRIKTIRGKLTQDEFAKQVGVARSSIVRYENGQREPNAEFLVKMQQVLGVDPLWLLSGDQFAGAGKEMTSGLSADETMLLSHYRNATNEGKEALLMVARVLCSK